MRPCIYNIARSLKDTPSKFHNAQFAASSGAGPQFREFPPREFRPFIPDVLSALSGSQISSVCDFIVFHTMLFTLHHRPGAVLELAARMHATPQPGRFSLVLPDRLQSERERESVASRRLAILLLLDISLPRPPLTEVQAVHRQLSTGYSLLPVSHLCRTPPLCPPSLGPICSYSLHLRESRFLNGPITFRLRDRSDLSMAPNPCS
jgi:hypothetical protein